MTKVKLLRDDQFAFLKKAMKKRISVWMFGRRWGKSTLALEGYIFSCIRKGLSVCYHVPNPSQYSEIWQGVIRVFGDGKDKELKKNKAVYTTEVRGNDKEIVFNTGAILRCFTGVSIRSIDKPRSKHSYIYIIDEAQSFRSEDLKNLVEAVALPMLIDAGGKMAIFGTVPKDISHYYARLFCRGAYNKRHTEEIIEGNVPFDAHAEALTLDNSQYISFRAPTETNPFLNKKALQDYINGIPKAVVDREVRAIFSNGAEDMFFRVLQDDEKAEERIFVDYDVPFLEGYHNSGDIWLSFDFNVNPMACIAMQYSEDYEHINVLKEFGLPTGSTDTVDITYTLKQIKDWLFEITGKDVKNDIDFPFNIYVTGDATGKSNTALKKNMNFYTIIQDNLGIDKSNIKIGNANPEHIDSYTQIYNWYLNHPNLKISKNCIRLKRDCKLTKMKGHSIDKKSYDPHYLDCLRYFFAFVIKKRTVPDWIDRINYLDDKKLGLD